MSSDLYTEFLDIPSGPRPPDHYTILGLKRFCSDSDLIEKAARDRLAQLDDFALHPDKETRDAVNDMMNHVARARVDLVNADRRATYDRTLAAGLGIAAPGEEPTAAKTDTAVPISIKPLEEEFGVASEIEAPAQPEHLPFIPPVEIEEREADSAAIKEFKALVAGHLRTWELTPAEERILAAEGYALGLDDDEARRIIRRVARRKYVVAAAVVAVAAIVVGGALLTWHLAGALRQAEFNNSITAARSCLDARDLTGAADHLDDATELFPNEPACAEIQQELNRLTTLVDETVPKAEKNLARGELDTAAGHLKTLRMELPNHQDVVALEENIRRRYISVIREFIAQHMVSEAENMLSEAETNLPRAGDIQSLRSELNRHTRRFVIKGRAKYDSEKARYRHLMHRPIEQQKIWSQVEDVAHRAREAEKQGRYFDAAKAYEQAAKMIARESVFAKHISDARRLLNARQFKTATKSIEKALGIRPDNRTALNLKDTISEEQYTALYEEAHQMMERGQYTAALAKVNKALEIRPEDHSLQNMKKKIQKPTMVMAAAREINRHLIRSDINMSAQIIRHWNAAEELRKKAESELRAENFREAIAIAEKALPLYRTIRLQLPLAGHSDGVLSIAFSPDNKLLASGGQDKKVIVWDIKTRQRLHTLPGGLNEVHAVAFSPDGKTLASTGWGIKLWNAATGVELPNLKLKGNEHSIAFSPDGKILASGGASDTIEVRDVNTGNVLHILKGHASWIYSVDFSPDGETLASASGDMTVKIWDVSEGTLLKTLRNHSKQVRSLAFSPGGRYLASGGTDIILWDTGTWRIHRHLNIGKSSVLTLAFCPDSPYLASASRDRTVKLWDIEKGVLLKSLTGHSHNVTSLDFSSDGALMASGSFDHTIRLWSVHDMLRDKPDTIRVNMKRGLTEEKTLAEINFNKMISEAEKCFKEKQFDAALKKLDWVLTTQPDHKAARALKERIESARFQIYFDEAYSDIDEAKYSSALEKLNKALKLRPGDKAARELREKIAKPGGAMKLANDFEQALLKAGIQRNNNTEKQIKLQKLWELAGKVMYDAEEDLQAGSLDAATRNYERAIAIYRKIRLALPIIGHSRDVHMIAYSPDGKYLVSASRDESTVRFWSPISGKELYSMKLDPDNRRLKHVRVYDISFSPDGKILATGNENNNIYLISTATRKKLKTLTGHNNGIFFVSFSSDGKFLASGSADNTIRIWNIASGKQCTIVRDQSGRMRSVAYSPVSTLLASGSANKNIFIWDAATGKKLHALAGHTYTVSWLLFSLDGKQLISRSHNSIMLWDTTTGRHVRTLKTSASKTAAISSDGRFMVTGGSKITFWNIATGKEIRTFKKPSSGSIFSIDFSPDGRYLAMGCTKAIWLLDLVEERLVAPPRDEESSR